MSVLYGKFEMPEDIKIEKKSSTKALFRAAPFERGFGHTIGNSLRRMMLSSLEAPAIVGVRIEGVSHEYQSIDGIIEDMTNIVLNLKGALLRKLAVEGEGYSPREERVLSAMIEVTEADLKEAGQRIVTLGDLMQEGGFDVINPGLELFTITKPMKRQVDLRIAIGRGYVPTERLEVGERLTNEMMVDALFSPVRLVNYRVENTRVGQDTDYDSLVLEVETDGRVSPEEALSFAAQIGLNHLNVFQQVEEQQVVFQREETLTDTDREEILAKLAQRIDEIELSVRSTNCLNGAGIRYIGELVVKQDGEMLQFRNFGKKSLGEIRDKLEEMELGFGMEDELARYGITRSNVKDLIEAFLAERASAAAAAAEENEDEE